MRQSQNVDLSAFLRTGGARIGLRTAVAAARPLFRQGSSEPTPRDEAAFWLTAAAEIEHALMVQYLYAAYSLNPASAGTRAAEVEGLKQGLLQIAREEMGHLITVQNLLLLIGAPLHLGREHSPFASQIYPFRFKLERVTADVLAKYVLAESPNLDPIPGLSDEDRQLMEREVEPRGVRSNDGEPVKNVGPVFHRLLELFAAIPDAGFRVQTGRSGHQARWDDWGFEAPRGTGGQEVLVHSFDQATAPEARTAALAAIEAIGKQGEAADLGTDLSESHFERFLGIFKKFAEVTAELGREPTWPVVRDPNLSRTASAIPSAPGHMAEAVMAERLTSGRIASQRTRDWAALFNLRYRLLLGYLMHSFLVPGATNLPNGDRTPRGVLKIWTFGEMRRIKKLAEKLVQMPLREDAAEPTAGPPFELPYTLNLPSFDDDRWRIHADVLENAAGVASALLAGPDAGDPFLEALVVADRAASAAALAIAATGQLPAGFHPSDYLKILAILEEGVRGFDVPPRHPVSSGTSSAAEGAFWHGRTRDQFVALEVAGDPAIVPGDPNQSALIKRIGAAAGAPRRMPRYRPRLPQSRIDAVRDWVSAGAPDGPAGAMLQGEPSPRAEPAGAPPSPPPGTGAPLPGQTESLSFQRDIRPLFRDFDRNTMMAFGLDLHDHQDVTARAADILERLEDGTMPCDGAWPPSQIELFRRWRDDGAPA